MSEKLHRRSGLMFQRRVGSVERFYHPKHLEVVPDEAVFEKRCPRVLDGEVPATEHLVAHVGAVTLPEHPGVFVPNSGSAREGSVRCEETVRLVVVWWITNLRTTMMRLSRRMVRIPPRYSKGVFKHESFREPGE